MTRALGLTAALLIAAASVATSGCDVNGYCINCANGDGGFGDAGGGVNGNGDGGNQDAGPPGDACVNSGIEVCDDIDNDCDGTVNELPIDGVGVSCSTNTGECQTGTTECVAGEIVCGGGAILPVPELCNNKDDDCDGVFDNGDPEGGGICGTDVGECVSGVEHCVNGAVDCVGDVPPAATETCNGRDDDCDGNFDEGIASNGSCGPTEGNTGECMLGSLDCVGGEFQCVGAAYPHQEQCDALDHDCDSNPTNGFDLQNDVRNCGSCGNDCRDDFMPADHVSSVRCTSGGCEIAQCDGDYWDKDTMYGTGCEFFCDTYKGPQELCNGEDDDCDGIVDEGVLPPMSCDGSGSCHDVCDIAGTPCAGGSSMCVSGGWTCTGWPSTVEVDGSGNIVPQESICDDADNDCDGLSDESFPQKGQPCNDGGNGICQRTGTFDCNSTNDGLSCGNLSPMVSPQSESCDGKDDDCNGTIDDGASTGALQDWVAIGGGIDIFAYEASRPDATAGSAGANTDHVCSKADALPWTGMTNAAAEAACVSVGARLCTESEWEQACTGFSLPTTYSSGTATTPADLIEFEAEDYHSKAGGAQTDWVRNDIPFHLGEGAMEAWPDPGTSYSRTQLANSPHLDFQVDFPSSGTWYVWIRGMGIDSNADRRVHAGLDGTVPTSADEIGYFPIASWQWRNKDTGGGTVTLNVTTAGVHTFNIYQRDDGFVIDRIQLTKSSSYDPNSDTVSTLKCLWSYDVNCATYQANKCNGNDYDTDGATLGDQDDILPTGTMSACYADWGAAGKVYDMSGNVKEWAQSRGTDANPFRGGASNNTAKGISCTNDFGVVSDTFAFPNVGFRCCRGP